MGAQDDEQRDDPDVEVLTRFSEERERLNEVKRRKRRHRKKKGADGTQDLKGEVEMDEHIIPMEDLFQRYETSIERGLSSAKHAQVLERDGPNALTPPKITPWYVKFGRHLFGGFSLLLWIAAFLALCGFALDPNGQENLYLAFVLIIVVTVTACFSYFQDAKSAKVMEGFKKMVPQQALVLRDGDKKKVPADDLVVGDIIYVKGGDKVPADIRVVESSGMKVDNSSLTGESEAQTRNNEFTDENPLETKNLAFYSTSMQEGACTGVVVNTGDRTVIGRIAGLASGTVNVETPIHKEIHHFIKIISTIAITLGIVLFLFGLLANYPFVDNMVFTIGIIVANVPEGLLATVTVALTLTSKRMARKHVLVKNLESVETLGSTTTICSDKTGTLTQNRMTLVHMYYDNSVETAETSTTTASFDTSSQAFKDFFRCMVLCNRAEFIGGDEDKPIYQRAVNGDASETALVKFAQPVRDILDVRNANPKLAEIPFNSTNKFQLSVHEQENPDDNRLVLVMKGAPERIIARCSKILVNGKEADLDDFYQQQFQETYDKLGGMGERVLGFAQMYLDPKFGPDYEFETDPPNFPMDNLTFLGLTGLIDPPRPAVPDAVKTCQQAGIKVIMVTGDHPITAKAIARQVNIITDDTKEDMLEKGEEISEENHPKAIVIHGNELREMTDDQLDEVLKYEQIVFARTSPQQKLRIVEGCQRADQIVAVTGDGVNDSPALKKADIGIAMGITGSDVSKEAADMILLDDNFASIVRGIEEGRLIFDNLKKSIAYTLSSNIPEILPFVLFIIIQFPLYLSTVLILCIDVGTDLWPAISLAYEKAESDIMRRKPRNAKVDKLVTAKLMSFAYLQIGIIQALAGIYTFFVVMGDFGFAPWDLFGKAEIFIDPEPDQATIKITPEERAKNVNALANGQTAAFASIIVVQWADLMVCKTRMLSLFQQGMRNMVLNSGMVFETILGLFIVYMPFLDVALGTRPLFPRHLGLPSIPFFFYILAYDELRKLWIRNNRGGWVEENTYY